MNSDVVYKYHSWEKKDMMNLCISTCMISCAKYKGSGKEYADFGLVSQWDGC